MATGQGVIAGPKTSDLERKERPEKEETEVMPEEPGQEMSFAELMNPEFIAQFKGCWRW